MLGCAPVSVLIGRKGLGTLDVVIAGLAEERMSGEVGICCNELDRTDCGRLLEGSSLSQSLFHDRARRFGHSTVQLLITLRATFDCIFEANEDDVERIGTVLGAKND